ncbi:MAG: 1-phosphofructokinase [Lachnospiraceae bacterium]|nr:1-phosphofructokinase [Lachnospiraceae bacterium]
MKNMQMNRIATVTLNPSLDYIVSVKDFKLGETNRTSGELLLPGGKGMNVSMVLKNLGFESTAFGFSAGFTGQELAQRLTRMGIRNELIELEEGLTRINVKLQSVEGTEINGQGPVIPEEKLEEMMGRLGTLTAGDVVFFSGSVPASLSKETYRRMMEGLQEGVMTVVDATGELLMQTLPLHPFLIKPNHRELSEIFGVTLTDRASVIPYAEKLQEMGARNVLVSMAGKGAVLLAENGSVYEAPVPAGQLVNGVGAGDSMVAGFVAGWLDKQDYEHAFFMGLAAGSASAFSERLASGEEIAALYQRITDTRGI